MNRKYSTDEFEKVVDRLRNTYKDVILTTDIIVGFPGETEEEFNITYEFLKKICFYKMHIFKYSRRKGTKADEMQNQISPEVQEIRSKKLLKLSEDNQIEYNKEYIGKIVEVLFEEKQGEYIKGHTQNYLMVNVKDKSIKKYHNKIFKVKIEGLIGQDLMGSVV